MSQLFEWRQLPFNMRVVLRSVSTFVDIWPENSLELAIVVLASSLHTMANGGHIDWQLVVQLEDGGGDVLYKKNRIKKNQIVRSKRLLALSSISISLSHIYGLDTCHLQ